MSKKALNLKSQIRRPVGYWTEENTIKELKRAIDTVGYFPSTEELYAMKIGDLCSAIYRHGGIHKFRELLGYEWLQKPYGYWTEENTIKELKKVIERIGRFPNQNELEKLKGGSGIARAIKKYGGINKFRSSLGYEVHLVPWNHEMIVDKLKKIIKKTGHFPINNEFVAMGRQDILAAMNRHGGTNKFRDLLGYELYQKSPNYWKDDNNITDELKSIIEKLKFFPSMPELINIGRRDLTGAILTHGGVNKFRMALGYPISIYEQYQRDVVVYCSRRGKNTEKIVGKILLDWCNTNSYPEPTYNKKLARHNVLEFVCNIGKTVGIDVTNTKNPFGHDIRKKYTEKDYYKYVDKLWIVVFSYLYDKADYIKWNAESPKNVWVLSVDDFLKELDYSADERTKNKIEAYKQCTFRTKDEYIKRLSRM